MTQINTTRWIEAADARRYLEEAAFATPRPEPVSLSEHLRAAIATLQSGFEDFVAAYQFALVRVPVRAGRRDH